MHGNYNTDVTAYSGNNQQRILTEQAKLLFKAAPLSVWGTYLGILFIVMVLWPVTDTTRILAWSLGFGFLNTLRLLHSLYRRRQPEINYLNWLREFALFAFLASCYWGAASVFLFPVGEPLYQLMMAFVLVTTCAIAITNISMLAYVIIPYVVITLAPLSIQFFLSTHEVMPLSTAMVFLAMLLLLSGAYRSYQNIHETINLKIQAQEKEKELRRSQSRHALYVQQTPMAFVEMDADMNITMWNEAAERIFGYSSAEVLGKHISYLTPAEIELETTQAILQAYVVNRNRTKKGEMIQCEWFNTQLRDEDGRLLGYSSLAQDVTERTRVEKMKEEFISIVSHELRTPLTSLRGTISLVKGGMTGELPEKATEFLTMAENNAERLTFLINDILDLQSIESGKLRFEFAPIDLYAIVQQAVSENQHIEQRSNVELQLHAKTGAVYVSADANRIRQVLDNLISNAIKFSPEDDVVTLSLDCENGTVRVSVCDNGPGVEPAFRKQLFEKFTQAEAANTRSYSGTGLGLSISRGIIEKHGGRIYYRDGEGGGSCFVFELEQLQQV